MDNHPFIIMAKEKKKVGTYLQLQSTLGISLWDWVK